MHKMPAEVAELTMDQYIVLCRSNKEKGGKVAVVNREQLNRLSQWYAKKTTRDARIEEAEKLYRLHAGE